MSNDDWSVVSTAPVGAARPPADDPWAVQSTEPFQEVGFREKLARDLVATGRRVAAGVERTAGAVIDFAGEHPAGEEGEPVEAMKPTYGAGDPLMAASQQQGQAADALALQPNERLTKGGVAGAVLGGASSVFDAPFSAQQAAADVIDKGGSEGQAFETAGAALPAAAIQMAAPELAGGIGGAAAKAALRGTARPAVQAAARLAGKAVGGAAAAVPAQAASTAVENLARPADQQQPLLPQSTAELAETVGTGAAFGLMAHKGSLTEAHKALQDAKTPEAVAKAQQAIDAFHGNYRAGQDFTKLAAKADRRNETKAAEYYRSKKEGFEPVSTVPINPDDLVDVAGHEGEQGPNLQRSDLPAAEGGAEPQSGPLEADQPGVQDDSGRPTSVVPLATDEEVAAARRPEDDQLEQLHQDLAATATPAGKKAVQTRIDAVQKQRQAAIDAEAKVAQDAESVKELRGLAERAAAAGRADDAAHYTKQADALEPQAVQAVQAEPKGAGGAGAAAPTVEEEKINKAAESATGAVPSQAPAEEPAAGRPALTPDEHAVAATAAGVHPDDVAAEAVAALVAHAERDPESAQELVNGHVSDASLGEAVAGGERPAASGAGELSPGAEPAGQASAANRAAEAEKSKRVENRPNGERSAAAPAREETVAKPEPKAAIPATEQAPAATFDPETATPAAGAKPGDPITPPGAPPRDTVNKDGLPVRTGENVGLVAGNDADGRTTIHSKEKPDWMWASHTDPETGEKSLKPYHLLESDDKHERDEEAEMQAGKDYYEAHRVATELQHARDRQMGFDPNEIEELRQPWNDAAAHEARARGNTTARVGTEPYRVSGEAGMREDGAAPDNRFILDRDGNKYTDPVHGKLLKSFEVVTAKGEDGGYAVIDANSGKVLVTGKTAELADKSADEMARARGRIRMKKFLEKDPPLSQQQLRETYKDQHPEARIGAEATAAPQEKADAVEQGQEQGRNEEELRGVRQGQDLRSDEEQVGQGAGGQAAGGGGDEGGGQEQAEAVKPQRQRKPLKDERLESAPHRAELDRMADNAGWAQIGGQIIRDGEGMSAEEAGSKYAGQVGNVVGRTSWVPNEPWFGDVQRSAGLPRNKTGRATREAVRKALARDPLTVRETRHVQALLDEADARRTEAAAFHEEDVNPTEQNMADAAAVQHAIGIDPDAVERASIQFEDDHPGFMAEIKRISDEHAEGAKESDAAPAGEGGEARPGDEGGAVQAEGDRGAAYSQDRPAGSERRPGLELESHTAADVADRERSQRDAAAAERSRVTEQEQRDKADTEVKDFRLTGSDRAADVATAGGQQSMFSHDEPTDLKGLERKVSADTGQAVKLREVPAPNMAASKLASAVKRMFGREVVFFRSDEPVGFSGVHIGGNKVFIRADTDKVHAQVIGHEFLHSLRAEQPDVYNRLMPALTKALNSEAGAAFKKRLTDLRAERGMTPLRADKLHEELMADVVGDHFADPAFIRELQKHLEPELYHRVLAHLADFLDQIRQKLGGETVNGKQAQRFVADIEAARAAVRDALAEVGPERGRGAEGVPAYSQREGGADFSQDEAKRQTETPEFKRWFGSGESGSKVVDADGNPKVVYHGSKRPDRIGAQFKKSRATSGPMSFFTEDPAIASNYATGKSDTSLEAPADYGEWFKYKPKGSRSEIDIDRLWYHLTPEQRAKISADLPHVTNQDENGDIQDSYRLGGKDEYGLSGADHWSHYIKEARGNVLKAAKEIWLNGGSIFGSEHEFMDIMRLGGVPMDNMRFDDPNAEYPGVLPTYLNIRNPLDTTKVTPEVISTLERMAARSRTKPAEYGADMWDKRKRDVRDWVRTLKDDEAKGENSHVWTSIPDQITESLKGMGYDGIKDVGGKMGGASHPVWIPFEENQVKSAVGNRGTFDLESSRIDYSMDTAEDPSYGDRITGVKNASIDEQRAQRGLDPLESESAKGDQEAWDDAARRMGEDPDVAPRLVDELLTKPRPISKTEVAMLGRRQVTLHNAYHRALDLIADPAVDEDTAREYSTRVAAIEDDMHDLETALRRAGTENSVGLSARRMMAREDYTLASMFNQVRAAKRGEQLTPEDREAVKDIHGKIDTAQKALGKKEEKADEQASKDQGKEVVDALKTKTAAEDVADKKAGKQRAPKKDAGEILKGMKRDKEAGKPFEDMGSYIQRLAEAFIRQGVDKLDPLVDAIHKVLAQHIDPAITRRQTMDALSGYGQFKKLNPDEVKTTLRDLRGQAQQTAKLQDIEAGRPPLKTGVERRTPSDEERRLIQKVNEAKRRFGVVETGSGDQLKSILDSIKTRLKNQISDLDYQIATGKKFVDEKTKVQYDAEAEELKKHRDLLKQQFDDIFGKPEMTDEQRIEAAKKATQASIDRYEARIKDKDFAPKPGQTKPTSPELEALKARRDQLKEEFETLKAADPLVQQAKLEDMQAQTRARIDELNRRITAGDTSKPEASTPLSSPELEQLRAERDRLTQQYRGMVDASPEGQAKRTAQRIDAANKALDEIEARIKAGDLELDGKPARTVSPEEQEIRDRLTAARKAFRDLQEQAGVFDEKRLQQAEDAAQVAVDALTKRIEAGDVSIKAGKPGPTSERLDALRQQRDALNRTLGQMRRAAMTPEEKNRIALQAFKTRVHGMIAETLERTARGDFAAKERRPLVLDEEGQKLQSQLTGAKKQFERKKLELRLKNRHGYEKWADFYTRWSRAALLSSPAVFGKLSAAAMARMVSTPIEEAAGAAIGKVLPQLAAKAPRQGGGFNVKAEAKAMREGIANYPKHFKDYLKSRGETEKALLYGHGSDGNLSEKDVQEHSLADWVGLTHGAFKNAVKEAEFARSYQKQTEHYIRNGVDVTNPAVQMQMGTQAWKDANRAIFLQDNRLVDYFNRRVGEFERKDKEGHASVGGKIAATALRTVFPVVRVPSNIVAEIAEYGAGLATGSAKYAMAVRKGIEKLEPEQADTIMRELKKGAIGLPLMLLGYFAPQMFGGYYQKGEKRPEADVRPGFVRVAGVDVPKSLTEAPAFQAAQIGSTIRRVADSFVSKKDHRTKGIVEGMLHGAFGLTSELPFVREATDWQKVFDAPTVTSGISSYLGELAKSKIVPGALQWVAREMDMDQPILSLKGQLSGRTTPRKTEGFAANLQEGIPVLRQELPRKKGSKPPATDYAKELLGNPEPQDVATQ